MSRVSETMFTIDELKSSMIENAEKSSAQLLPMLSQIALSLAEIADTVTELRGNRYTDAVKQVSDRLEGEWMIAFDDSATFHYCSNCREHAYRDEFGNEILSDFCPDCGISML